MISSQTVIVGVKVERSRKKKHHAPWLDFLPQRIRRPLWHGSDQSAQKLNRRSLNAESQRQRLRPEGPSMPVLGLPSGLITPAATAFHQGSSPQQPESLSKRIFVEWVLIKAADLLPWNLFQLNRGGVTTRKPDQVNHCKQMYVCFWIQLVSIAGKYAWQGCSVFPTIQRPACQCCSCTHPDISELHSNLLGTAPSWSLNRTELLECRAVLTICQSLLSPPLLATL